MCNCIQLGGTSGPRPHALQTLLILEFVNFIDQSLGIGAIPELANLVDKPPCRLRSACFSVFCHVYISLIGRWDWVLENVIELDVERLGDSKRHFKGRGVSAFLDGDHGLTRYADVACESRLAHLALGEPERPNRIGDSCWFDHA
jgi:hypothetical protein